MITLKPYKFGLILAILIATLTTDSIAQQDSQYTQYMYNTQTINPAYAGNRGMLSLNGLHRTQWVGLDGAPTTYNFSMSTPVGTQGVGLGLSFYSDRIGPSDESSITADFSYTIRTSDEMKFSFGIKGGLNILNVDYSRLNIYYPQDQTFSSNVENRLFPVVGVGAYLHHTDKWYIGLSAPNLLKTDHYDDIQVTTASERLHAYLIGGYVFDLNSTTKFKPSALIKAVSGAPLAVDVSANFLFNEKFTLGAAYRLDAVVSALAGFQISDQLMIGYAYDYDTTELARYNSGSHEIFLRFEFLTRSRRIVNPRFF